MVAVRRAGSTVLRGAVRLRCEVLLVLLRIFRFHATSKGDRSRLARSGPITHSSRTSLIPHQRTTRKAYATTGMSEEQEIAAKIGELGEQIKAAKTEKKPKEEWEPILNEMLALKVSLLFVLCCSVIYLPPWYGRRLC